MPEKAAKNRTKEVVLDVRFNRTKSDGSQVPWDGVFLKIQKLKAESDADTGAPPKDAELECGVIYAFVHQGRAYECELKQIKSYVHSARTAFHRNIGSCRAHTAVWQDRWEAVARYTRYEYPNTETAFPPPLSKLSGKGGKNKTDARIEYIGNRQDTRKHAHSFVQSLGKKSGKPPLDPVRFLHRETYRIWMDDALAYILLDKDEHGRVKQSFYPFSKEPVAISSDDAKKVCHHPLEHSTLRILSNNQFSAGLSADGYADLFFFICRVDDVMLAQRVVSRKAKHHAALLPIVAQMAELFHLNTAAVKSKEVRLAQERADEALEHLGTEFERVCTATKEAKEVDKAARAAFTWFTRGGLSRGGFETYYHRLWRKHDGDFGPVFVAFVLVCMLDRTAHSKKLHDWLGQRLGKRPFKKQEVAYFKAPKKKGSFLVMDEAQHSDPEIAEWYDQEPASWIHKSLTMSTRVVASYSTSMVAEIMQKTDATKAMSQVNEQLKALARKTSPLAIRLGGFADFKALSATIKKIDEVSELLDASGKIKANPGTFMPLMKGEKALVAQVDDVFGAMKQLSKELSNKDLPGAKYQAAIRKINKAIDSELGKSAQKLSMATHCFNLVRTGFTLVTTTHLLLGIRDASATNPEITPREVMREILATSGAVVYSVADLISSGQTLGAVVRKAQVARAGGSFALCETAASTRFVGKSAVFGGFGAAIGLVVAAYDYSKAIDSEDTDEIIANILNMSGTVFTSGAAILATGGIGFAIFGLGLIMLGLGAKLGWFKKKTYRKAWAKLQFLSGEQEAYEHNWKLWELANKHQHASGAFDGGRWARLTEVVQAAGSYRGIPMGAFVFHPKLRVSWQKKPRARPCTWTRNGSEPNAATSCLAKISRSMSRPSSCRTCPICST